MKLERQSPLTGKWSTMEIPLTEKEFAAAMESYEAGALIQNAFPTLDAEQREFILTGYTPEDWKTMFPEECE